MKYKELVEEWNKSREYAFDYKFEIGSAFMPVYHYIAEYFNYDKKDRLNDFMRLYPINEINEEKMLTSMYSLYGAITYEKFGWSALILQINTVDSKNNDSLPKGYYRFVFYIKRLNDKWYFCIDELPYKEDSLNGQTIYTQKDINSFVNSSLDNYQKQILDKLIQLIPQKISWEKKYTDILQQKSEEIKEELLKHLEVDERKLKPYSTIKNIKTNKGFLVYELNDWCTYTLDLLLEIDVNTYPKLDYVFPFHFKYKNENWYVKLSDDENEKKITSRSDLQNALNDFCVYRDTFKKWLSIGEKK